MRNQKIKARADYDWGMRDGVIWIEDLNLGNVSVTNDIENVIEDIVSSVVSMPEIMVRQMPVVYRDSDGQWDGWDNETKEFIPTSGLDRDDAIAQIGSKVFNK